MFSLRSCLLLAPLLAIVLAWIPEIAPAQLPNAAIEPGTPLAENAAAIQSALALRKAGKLLNGAQVTTLLGKPQPVQLTLQPPSRTPLSPRQVYSKARGAFIRLGWLCKVAEGEPWLLDLAAGYAIADGGVVATAAHVLSPREEVQEAYLLAVTLDGRALPVRSILAANGDFDAAIVRVEGFQGQPLPLSADVMPGDAAYCLSDPVSERGYFSMGMVNRFYWSDADSGDVRKLDGIKQLRLNVSTPWAPGSSGAAVLDASGNAIGHVWSIVEVGYGGPPAPDANQPRATSPKVSGAKEAGAESAKEPAAEETSESAPVFQLHTAIPARSVRLLAESMGPAPAQPQAAPRSNPTRRRWRSR